MTNPTVHWEAGAPPPPQPFIEALRWADIKRQHLAKGYHDIAYNHGVGDSGTLLTGRGWDRDSAANGTDANGVNHNPGSRCICWLGGPGYLPSRAALATIRAWVAEARRRGYTAAVVPHSYWVATQCCGDFLRAWMALGMPITASAPVPAPPAASPQEDDMPQAQIAPPGSHTVWITDGITKRPINGGDPERVEMGKLGLISGSWTACTQALFDSIPDVRTLQDPVDPNALAVALAPLLPAVTPEALEAALAVVLPKVRVESTGTLKIS
jgi:hypothetical protein